MKSSMMKGEIVSLSEPTEQDLNCKITNESEKLGCYCWVLTADHKGTVICISGSPHTSSLYTKWALASLALSLTEPILPVSTSAPSALGSW